MTRPPASAEFRCRTCDAVAMVVGRKDDSVTVTGFLGNTWLSL